MLSPWFVSSQIIHNSPLLSLQHLCKRIILLTTIFMADFMGRVRSFRLTTAFGKLLEATSIPIKKSCLNRSENSPQRNTKVLAKEYEVLNSYGLVLCALCGKNLCLQRVYVLESLWLLVSLRNAISVVRVFTNHL